MKGLRSADLLLDQDIVRFNLLGLASQKESFKRIDYLLKIYPKALSIRLPSGDLPIHPSNCRKRAKIDVFARLLKAGMQHYPEKFGFLFKCNQKGERPITQAIAKYGKHETLQTIQTIIPSNGDHPILHYVFRYMPDLSEDFICRYPDALYLKDRKGRHLLHVAVKSGLKMSGYLFMMIHSNKGCIEKKDPVTNLYPFMLAAASGRKKDLTTIYKLLSLRPKIISKCLDGDGTG